MRQRRVLQLPAWRGCGQSMRLVATLELCSMISAKQPPALYPHLHTPPSLWQRWGKVHTITGHAGPEVEKRHNSILSLTSALEGVGGQRHAPAALTPGKTRYSLYRWLGGPQVRSERVRNILPPPGFDPRTVQPVASRYAAWAILAHPFIMVLPVKRISKFKVITNQLNTFIRNYTLHYIFCSDQNIMHVNKVKFIASYMWLIGL